MRRAAAILALALLAACGGGGGGTTGTPVTPVTPTTAPQSTTGTAQLQIVIPSVGPTVRRKTAVKRLPFYASAGTQSIAIAINGTPVQPSAVQQVCNAAIPSGTVCTFSFPAPAGNDTFAVALGDASYNVLSEGTVQMTIVANQVNVLHLTLYGLPAHVTLKLDTPNPPVGQSATVHLSAIAYDASNNQILGDDYYTPISVASDDKSGQTTLSKTQLTSPSDSIDVTYSGKLMQAVNFSATVPSSSSNAVATFAPNPYQSFTTTYMTFQVARGGDGNPWFTECKQGNAGPCKIGTITASGQVVESADVGYAEDLTAGPDGNVWFTENNLANVGKITPSMQITEYQTKALAPNEAYYGGPIVTGPDGNLWFLELSDIAQVSPAGQVLNRYPVNAAWSQSMIVGPDGNFWIAAAQDIDRVTPAGVVTSFAFNGAYNLTAGADGQIYFVGSPLKKIAMDGTISSVPSTGSSIGIGGPLTLGPDKNIWGSAASTNAGIYSEGVGVVVPSTGAIAMYPLLSPFGAGFPSGSANFGSAWASDGNLYLPTGTPSMLRFRYDP